MMKLSVAFQDQFGRRHVVPDAMGEDELDCIHHALIRLEVRYAANGRQAEELRYVLPDAKTSYEDPRGRLVLAWVPDLTPRKGEEL